MNYFAGLARHQRRELAEEKILVMFNNAPVDSRHLRVFCTVAATGSLTEAARRMCLTRTALSHSLKALEVDLGCTLFVRGPGGLTITEVGSRLLPKADALLAAMQEVRQLAASGEEVR